MDRIPLEAIPNQSFEVVLDNLRYGFVIKEIGDAMAVTITRDDVTLVEGQRIPANEPLLPYRHLENGNFIMLSDDDEIPYYTSFGSSQRLVWIPRSELEAFRGDN